MENNKNIDENSSVSNNYDLKSEAVEALTNADSEPAPEYSQEELEQYRSKSGIKIPEIVKVLFLKAWFAGAVCFFFIWGLGNYLPNSLDMLFITGIALGMVTDLLLNNVLRFIEPYPGANSQWMMVNKRGSIGLFLNILYGFLVLICVFLLYNLINYTIIQITGNTDTIPLGVEPILFGVFCMGFDMLFVGIKHLILKLFKKS